MQSWENRQTLPQQIELGASMITRTVLPGIIATIAAPAVAESPHFYLTGGYAFQGVEGWEVELGGQFDFDDRIYFRASPANVVFFDGDPPVGFYSDTFSNGQTRCRNQSNGQFANDANCVTETDSEWRGSLDGYIRINPNVLIGGGGLYTFQSDDDEREGAWTGFGALMFEANERLGFELRGSGDYAAVRARVAF